MFVTPRLRRYLLCVLALLAVGLSTSPAADIDQVLIASITWDDGRTRQHLVEYHRTLKLDTCAGDLAFPCSRLSTIRFSEGTDSMMVTLVSGERWRAAGVVDVLDAFGIERGIRDLEAYGRVESISFSGLPQDDDRMPSHYMKLFLEDQSVALVDPTELVLPVETEYGRWQLPVGSVQALRFSTPHGGERPEWVQARFPTGHLERLGLGQARAFLGLGPGTFTLRARDCHGNKLKIEHRDVKGILSPFDLADSAATEATPSSPRTYDLTRREGSMVRVSIPFLVWEIKTKAGSVSLPSPLVSRITRDAEERDDVTFRTVYGEILTGKWTARAVAAISDNPEGYVDIEADDIAELVASTPSVPIPDDWLVFYASRGIAVVARFAKESTGLLTEDDKAVPPSLVHSLTPAADDGFAITTRSGQVLPCRPKTRAASLVLLSNGQLFDLPWKDIALAQIQPTVEEATLESVVAAGVSEADEGERVRLSTALGTLRLPPEAIGSIAVDREAGRACVTTTRGDHFLVSIPGCRWVASLLGDDDFEFPDEERFVVTVNSAGTVERPRNSVICRLMSGDILHGTLTPQELSLRRKGSRRDLPVSAMNIERLSRNFDGDLSFRIKSGGDLVAEATESALAIVLHVTGETNDVSFGDIEALCVSLSGLPPPTVFRPGLPAFLTGEILVTGGMYEQGSDRGIEDEQPMHTVYVGSFFMDATEVTRAQYAAFVRATGHTTASEDAASATTWIAPGFLQHDDDPVVCLSWGDAAAYCNWRSKEAGLSPCYTINKNFSVETDRMANGYRLPTEAEWEFAARNRGKGIRYPWSDGAAEVTGFMANYRQDSTEAGDGWEWTNPVKVFPVSPLGFYGLAGNVWEWCEDWYWDRAYTALRSRLARSPCITLDSAPLLTRRVMRGGSFRNELDLLRCTSRGSGQPFSYAGHVGFRCARNAQ